MPIRKPTSKGEALSLVVSAALTMSALSLAMLAVVLHDAQAAMMGDTTWVLEWMLPVFAPAMASTYLLAGLLSALGLWLMWIWRGQHNRGFGTVLGLFIGLALGAQVISWIWTEWLYR